MGRRLPSLWLQKLVPLRPWEAEREHGRETLWFPLVLFGAPGPVELRSNGSVLHLAGVLACVRSNPIWRAVLLSVESGELFVVIFRVDLRRSVRSCFRFLCVLVVA